MSSLLDKLFRVLAVAAVSLSNLIFPKAIKRVVDAGINGCRLLVLVNEDVGREIVFGRCYELRDTRALRCLLKSDDICFDVGANVGYYTNLFAKIAPQGMVYAFEPVPLHWHLLNAGLIINGLKNVCLNQCALGEFLGEVDFSVSQDGAYSSFTNTRRSVQNEKIQVRLETIDDYCKKQLLTRVDVLKIDVEGAELQVLKGASSLLSKTSHRPRVLVIELYDQNLNAYGASIDDVVEYLAAYEYSPFVADQFGKLMTYKQDHRNRVCNVFFMRT